MNRELKLLLFASLVILLGFWGHGVFAQNAPVTAIATVANVIAGQQVVVPITVVGFNSVGSFSLTIDYDYSKLHLVSGIQNPALSGVFNMGDNNLGSGMHRIVMGWFSSGVSLPDGSFIVNLTFTFLSGSPALEWFEMGPSCEYSDQFANVLNDAPTSTYFVNGRVCGITANPGQVAGSNTICQGSTGISYSIAPIANVTGYTWSVPAGATISGGVNSNSITVDYSTGAVSGNISVCGMNECGNGPVSTLPVTVNTLPAASAGNDTIISSGAAIQLHAASGGTGNYAYYWAPANLLINPNVQNPFTVPLTNSSLFVLQVTNTSGQCQTTDEMAVTVSGAMLTASPTVVPGAICNGQSAQLLANVGGGSGVYTYNWTSVPPGTPAWNSTLANPFVNPGENTQYLLVANDGIMTINGSANLLVHQLPTAQVSGGGALCDDGSQATITIDLTGIPPWSFTCTNGINSNFFNAIHTSPFLLVTNDPGIYSVTSVQDMNCSGTSTGNAEVLVYPVPPAPVINYAGIYLASNAPNGNQWYYNNQLLQGATGQLYTPVYNGQYFNIVTENGCSSDTSNIVDIMITGTKPLDENSISLFPNPANDHVTLLLGSYKGKALNLTLLTSNGVNIYERKYAAGEIGNEINMNTEGLNPGVYFLKIEADNSVLLKKILILRE